MQTEAARHDSVDKPAYEQVDESNPQEQERQLEVARDEDVATSVSAEGDEATNADTEVEDFYGTASAARADDADDPAHVQAALNADASCDSIDEHAESSHDDQGAPAATQSCWRGTTDDDSDVRHIAGSRHTSSVPVGVAPSLGVILEISVARVVPSPYQSRVAFDRDAGSQLVDSVRVNGVIQPIIVRLNQDGMYELIAGERRWRATKELGLVSIPAVVRENVSDLRARMMTFVETSARLSCRPLEQARELASLLEALNATGEPMEGAELARGMGIGRTLRWQLLKIARNITPDVVELVKRDFGHEAADAVVDLPKSRLLSAAKQKLTRDVVRILAKAPSEMQEEYVRACAEAAPSVHAVNMLPPVADTPVDRVHAVNTSDSADDGEFFDFSWSLTRSLALSTTRPIADMPPGMAVRLLQQLTPAVEALRERARAA